jgi:hypothetical protein
MKLVLKNGATKKEIEAMDRKLFKRKISGGFDAKKYNGVLSLKADPLAIQFKFRDEWDRNINPINS